MARIVVVGGTGPIGSKVFTTTTRTLLEAEAKAGVGHHVALKLPKNPTPK